ncbi:phage holin family protein [Ramlibacter sp.]|uniref:phage holin family protein n=1 Tax=Ramlibacter sp. TaxID=1917967 RepID=UPI003D0F1BB1
MFERGLLRRVAASGVQVLRQRVALAALDVEQELLFAGCAIAALLAFTTLAALALAALGLAVIAYWWEDARVAASLGVATFFASAAGFVAWRLAVSFRTKPPFLHATLEELERDRDALRPEARP